MASVPSDQFTSPVADATRVLSRRATILFWLMVAGFAAAVMAPFIPWLTFEVWGIPAAGSRVLVSGGFAGIAALIGRAYGIERDRWLDLTGAKPAQRQMKPKQPP